MPLCSVITACVGQQSNMLANEHSHALHDMVDTLRPGSSLVRSRAMMSLSSCFCKQGGDMSDSATQAFTRSCLGSEFLGPRAHREVCANVCLPLVDQYLLAGFAYLLGAWRCGSLDLGLCCGLALDCCFGSLDRNLLSRGHRDGCRVHGSSKSLGLRLLLLSSTELMMNRNHRKTHKPCSRQLVWPCAA